MNSSLIRLDPQHREIVVHGHRRSLVEKEWQVLALLIEHTPAVVARNTFIDEIWQGNWVVGDKNLNQTIWSLRRAISDQSRAPTCIRTMPRAGYQWIGPRPKDLSDDIGFLTFSGHRISKMSAAFVLLPVTLAIFLFTYNGFRPGEAIASGYIAESAYIVGQDVHVQFKGGLIGILKNTSRDLVGLPTLSDDGTQIAITAEIRGRCQLLTFDLNTRESSEFDGCPSDRIE